MKYGASTYRANQTNVGEHKTLRSLWALLTTLTRNHPIIIWRAILVLLANTLHCVALQEDKGSPTQVSR